MKLLFMSQVSLALFEICTPLLVVSYHVSVNFPVLLVHHSCDDNILAIVWTDKSKFSSAYWEVQFIFESLASKVSNTFLYILLNVSTLTSDVLELMFTKPNIKLLNRLFST